MITDGCCMPPYVADGMTYPPVRSINPSGYFCSGISKVLNPINIGFLAFGQVERPARPVNFLNVYIALIVASPGGNIKGIPDALKVGGQGVGP